MSLTMEQTLVMTEDGSLELTPISQNCLLHAVEVLAPTQSSVLLPSGAYKIEQFSKSLLDVIKSKAAKKKTASDISLTDENLLPSIEISKFYEGAMSITDFTKKIEKKLVDISQGSLDLDSLHRACWKVYDLDKRSAISHPKWLSPECTYRLWLIYNCVLEKDTGTRMPRRTANEVLKRIVELCGYTWNSSYQLSEKITLDFPEYLDAITRYFTYLKLETSLTCEVILDMVDEVVHGVIRKGYLIKKGHVRKNRKKRWFVLQRTVLKYFESLEKPVLKGQLMLNSKTQVESLPDKSARVKFCFKVTCGSTGVPFEISAETQRSKNEWMLAIRKAIALAKVLDGSSKSDDFEQSLAGFYLVKYGTSQPALETQDSDVRQMKYHVTIKGQRQRLSGRNRGLGPNSGSIPEDDEDELEPQDEYMPMQPYFPENITSDDSEDEEGYLEMSAIRQQNLSESYEADDQFLDTAVSLGTSAPAALGGRRGSGEDVERSIKVRLSQLGPLPPLGSLSGSESDLTALLGPPSPPPLKDGSPNEDEEEEEEEEEKKDVVKGEEEKKEEEEEEEEDGSGSESENYTVMDPDKPRYFLRPKDVDGDGHYVDMLREQRRQAEDSGRGSLGNDDTNSVEDAEVSMLMSSGAGVGKAVDLSVPLDPSSRTSPNQYLTVLHSPPSPSTPSTPHTVTSVTSMPPIPPHRSPGPRRYASSERLIDDESKPPTPPPRSKTLAMKGQRAVSSTMVTFPASVPLQMTCPLNPPNRLSHSDQFRRSEFIDRRQLNCTISSDSMRQTVAETPPPLPPR